VALAASLPFFPPWNIDDPRQAGNAFSQRGMRRIAPVRRHARVATARGNTVESSTGCARPSLRNAISMSIFVIYRALPLYGRR